MKKKTAIIVTIVIIVLLIPIALYIGAGILTATTQFAIKQKATESSVLLKNEEIEKETEENELDLPVTTIHMDIAQKLTNYDDSLYESSPVIDWKQYNSDFTSCRFWLLSIENKDAYIVKDGLWYTPCKKITEISNDTADVWTDEEGKISLSFKSGDLHCKLICDNANRYYILITDWSGFSTCKLGEKNVEIQACYTGIPLSDISELTGYPENTLVSMIKDETILEDTDLTGLLQLIQDCVFDWNDFCDDIWEYAENDDTLLPEEYVSAALEKANMQKEAELAQLQQEQEAYEQEMKEIGALKIKAKSTVIETESELPEEELNQYSQKGKLSDFGLKIKYLDDNCERFEYVVGYTLTEYFLEDGTPLDYTLVDENSDSAKKIKDAGGLDMGVRLVTPDGTSYCLCGFNFSTESNYASAWVMEENQYIEYLKKNNE